MLKCIILEDDELAAASLKAIINRTTICKCLGVFDNAFTAIKNTDFNLIDVVFVDINLPDINGLDFIKAVPVSLNVIITTSEKKFAYDALNLSITEFILKPVTIASVTKSLNVIYHRLSNSRILQHNKAIFIKVDSRFINIKLNNILFIEAFGDYIKIYQNDISKVVLVKMTLTGMLKQLDENTFCKVHRSYVVNLDFIQTIDDSSLVINGKLIPISRSNRQTLLNKLNLLK